MKNCSWASPEGAARQGPKGLLLNRKDLLGELPRYFTLEGDQLSILVGRFGYQ